MPENITQKQTYRFALQIILLSDELREQRKEYVLTNQILKSGTSIGANVEESIGAQSKKDFLSKILIVYKEARETRYWLLLLRDSGTLISNRVQKLLNDGEEIIKILGKIQSSTKKVLIINN